MPVRILCLHGQGVNSTIFHKQTESIREMISSDYQFCFFDGEVACEPAPEVQDFFPPPYLTWYNTPTTKKVLEAHRQVRGIIDRHGPFDAVLGFSQGGAVAASMLLHDELAGVKPTFNAAIFLGSPIPFSHRTDVGVDVRKYFGVSGEPPNEHGRPTELPQYLLTDPSYLRNPAQLENASCEGVQYQMFHATADEVRIRVPTGHVMGTRDQWYFHSKDVADLCCVETRTIFQHDGGHEVPAAYTEELCDIIETVLAKI